MKKIIWLLVVCFVFSLLSTFQVEAQKKPVQKKKPLPKRAYIDVHNHIQGNRTKPRGKITYDDGVKVALKRMDQFNIKVLLLFQ